MLTLILIFIPFSLFIGIAASAIGYTAWPLVVPVLFVVFGFDLYLSIFISILIDFINSFIISIIALKKGQIRIRTGLKLMLFACIFIFPAIYVGTKFIPQNTDIFKGSIGFFNILFALMFIRNGYKVRVFHKNYSLEHHGTDQAPEYKINIGSDPEKLFGFKKEKLIYAGVAFMAMQTGLLGMGGGMGHAVFLILFLSLTTLTATGTAMLITCGTTLLGSFGFFMQITDKSVFTHEMIVFIPVILAMSAIGTMIGSRITYNISEEKLNYMIAGVMIIAGLIVIFQGLFMG